MYAVECRGLTRTYGNIVALDNLDISVEEGVIFGFLGPNGAGKTTTLRILTGLGRATSGSARVAGEVVRPNSTPLQSKIGYLPEEPAFYNWMTGREFLTYAGRLFRLPGAETARRCDELLELVDLSGAASRRIGGYSRGMRQRLGIAQALINRPAVLFLDEPGSALDPLGRAEVLQTLLRLKAQATTVFLSSHILADVERVCDIVAIVDKGRLVVKASIEELRRRFARSLFELEFEEKAASLADALGKTPWVEKVDVFDGERRLVVSTSDVSTAKRELPGLVAGSGLALHRYELVLPTLEQVFIELVGKKGG
ncbi:MAG: ABC transporter ATP-binding protein [Dehalococcoidia bacterium]|nr:ABC transporter ATP-binding protein [Dehalococcoidia bacterium]